MANYSLEGLIDYGFLDPSDTVMLKKASMELESAAVEVENDLDCATFADYETEDGSLPEPLVTAIYMKCMLNISNPEGVATGSAVTLYAYEKKIKPYVRFVSNA